mmetsp:Transcript_4034/g.4159  ORF Transcript_4034/g.4159 Transcript_4034/m.4159 type:complete len:193 (+) Transcript_4034:117-695(+)
MTSFVRPNCDSLIRAKKLGKSYIWLETDGELLITMGPHWPGVLVVVFLILGGTYMSFMLIDLIPSNRGSTLPILFRLSSTFFFTITMASLMLTACSDPGIVRATPISGREETEEELENTIYCEICSIYQPERLQIRHCQECDVCILNLDHHCPWMGKCIGQKNMKWFIMFNVSWLCYFAQMLILCFAFQAPP